MDRREFIKITAITGTSATLASCGSPENQLIRFIPEDELVPGIAVWKPSVCPVCRAGCGVIARVMEGEADVVRNGQPGVIKMGLARKLEGNPAHPISQGKLCPRGQAAIQITYHPDRLTQPLKRTGARGSGQFQAVTWDQALGDLLSRLDALASAGEQQSLAFLMRSMTGRRRDLVSQFLSRFGAPPPLTFELFSDDVLRRANALSFGYEQLPTLDLERSRYLLAFGADLLGTWNSPVSQNAGYGKMRQGRPGVRGKFVQVEPRMSQTGANADEWVPVRPGTDGILALGLAHAILKAGLRPADAAGRAGALIEGWSGGLPAYSPQQVETRTGVPASRIERLARELVEHRPAVAVIGGAPLAQTNGLFQALAVNALQALITGIGEPGGIFFTSRIGGTAVATTSAPPDARSRSLESLARSILAAERSPVQLLLLDDANPVFGTPLTWKVRDALQKIPFIASFGSFLDETSVLADLILPDHSFLESWVEGQPESGAAVPVASLAPPVMRPLHQTRAMPDVLLEVGRRLHAPLNPPLPWQTFEAMLQEGFKQLPSPPASPGAPAADPWATVQAQGGWWGAIPTRPTNPSPPTRPTSPSFVTEPQFDGDASQYPFHLLPYASQAFLDGSVAHLPWLQELPDPLTSAMWSTWVEINPRTAERLQIAEGDVIEITSQHGRLQAPALLFPGIAPDVIAMPVGQGHEAFTRFASGRGANPIGILAPVVEPETGTLAWAATRVRVSRAGGRDGRLILFAGGMRENPHEHEGR